MPEIKNSTDEKKQKVVVCLNKGMVQRVKEIARQRSVSVSSLVAERLEILFAKHELQERENSPAST